MESHVFLAEHFHDAVNGLYTTLTTFSVCNATPAGRIPLTLLLEIMTAPHGNYLSVCACVDIVSLLSLNVYHLEENLLCVKRRK